MDLGERQIFCTTNNLGYYSTKTVYDGPDLAKPCIDHKIIEKTRRSESIIKVVLKDFRRAIEICELLVPDGRAKIHSKV